MKRLEISVKPNAKASSLEEQPDGTWIARIAAPPVDGKANAALIELVARHFSLRKNQVSIKIGQGSRRKLVDLDLD